MLKGFSRKSYYGRTTEKPVRVEGITPPSKTIKKAAPKTQIDSFEAEYQKFIAELKAKKATEEAKNVESVVEEPKIEEVKEEPIVEETKKTRKKKVEVVEEESTGETTIDRLD